MIRDHIDFQDRSHPLAYLITIRCYGTWLHGDERGSVDRARFNRYGEPKIEYKPKLVEKELSLLRSPPFLLKNKHRPIVEDSLADVCANRSYALFALNVRTNHVHAVVSASDKPELIMNSFKAYTTRALKAANEILPGHKVWSRHGSTLYLWTERHIEHAVDYVLNGQGDKLPTFD